MKNHRWLTILVSVLLIVSLLGLTACSGPSAQAVGYDQELTGTVKVYSNQDSFFMAPMYKQVLGQFGNGQKGLTVDHTSFDDPAALEAQLLKDLEAGTMPDLLLCDSYSGIDVHRMIAEGYLKDLTEWVDADSTYDEDAYFGAAVEACRVNGQIYALPLSVSPALLLSSEERLETAMIDWESAYTAEEKLALLAEYRWLNMAMATTTPKPTARIRVNSRMSRATLWARSSRGS